MTRSYRTALRLSPLFVLGALAVACSAGPDETAEPTGASTSEALTHCNPGYVLVMTGDTDVNGKPIEECEQPAAAAHTGPATPGVGDTCGTTTIPTPASLAGCTPGTLIDGEPVFACPVGTKLPATLGLVSVEAGQCGFDAPKFLLTCEQVIAVTSFRSNCLGSPLSGWELVIDNVALLVSAGLDGGGTGGACPGGCALVPNAPGGRQ